MSKPTGKQQWGQEPRPNRDMAAALRLLAVAIEAQTTWLSSRAKSATLADLKRLEKKLMATIAEVAQSLRTANERLKKVGLEIDGFTTEFNVLKEKVKTLEEALASAGSEAPTEISDAATAVVEQTGILDEKIPDKVGPVPDPDPGPGTPS